MQNKKTIGENIRVVLSTKFHALFFRGEIIEKTLKY